MSSNTVQCCAALHRDELPLLHCRAKHCHAALLHRRATRRKKRPHVRKEKKALLGMTCLIPPPYTRTAEGEDAVEEEVVTVEEVVENAAKPTRCRP